MKKILVLIPICVLCGCSFFTVSFKNAADGSVEYTSKLVVAPFSKMDQGVAKMGYDYDQKAGNIAVGQDVKGVDQTGQIQAAKLVMDALVKAAQAYAASQTGGASSILSAIPKPSAPSPSPAVDDPPLAIHEPPPPPPAVPLERHR